MAVREDMDGFFKDFGTDAELKPQGGSASTFKAIFDARFVVVVNGVESSSPVATCRTSDVKDAAHGDEMYINETTYNIIGIEPDGTGITVLILSKDAA